METDLILFLFEIRMLLRKELESLELTYPNEMTTVSNRAETTTVPALTKVFQFHFIFFMFFFVRL